MVSPSSVPKPVLPLSSKLIHFAICALSRCCKGSVIRPRCPYPIVVLMPVPASVQCIIGGAADLRYSCGDKPSSGRRTVAQTHGRVPCEMEDGRGVRY